MIDREKVIKGLECHAEVNCVECPYRDGWRTCPFGETLLADAIALLKEQEPVRPTWLQGKAYCSSCGLGFPRKREDMEINYCSHCGQGVKWE